MSSEQAKIDDPVESTVGNTDATADATKKDKAKKNAVTPAKSDAKASDNKFAKATTEKPQDGEVILDRPDVDNIEFNSNGIENFNDFDPFTGEGEEIETRNIIHIRIQQRNGRKTLTTVQGLPEQFDQRKILKVIKKKFACNGTTVQDKELGEVIQLQGDQRRDILEFLIDSEEGLDLDERDIKVHGF